MNKLIKRTVTITITETWTITWADGAEQTVVYQARQPDHVLPLAQTSRRVEPSMIRREAHSSLCAPVAQTGSS